MKAREAFTTAVFVGLFVLASAPIEPPVDTAYVKHVRIQSELLTEFWGRPMYLGAHVLLPHGFEEHPEARYPNHISRLRDNTMYLPRILERIVSTAPEGADLTSWRY